MSELQVNSGTDPCELRSSFSVWSPRAKDSGLTGGELDGKRWLRDRAKEKTALLPAPFRCTYAWNRPTSTGAGGSDPFWLCWRGKPWLAIRWRGYAASKWSQLERQLILGQRLSSIATSQYRQLKQPGSKITHRRRYGAAARAYASSTSTRKTAARFSMDDRCFVRSWERALSSEVANRTRRIE
jgi:hypothetical protein